MITANEARLFDDITKIDRTIIEAIKRSENYCFYVCDWGFNGISTSVRTSELRKLLQKNGYCVEQTPSSDWGLMDRYELKICW